MEKILDRFLRYVAVDTQSNEESESQPSAEKELNLLRMLQGELEAMAYASHSSVWIIAEDGEVQASAGDRTAAKEKIDPN